MRVAAGRGTHSLRYPVPKYVNSQHLAWPSLLTLIKPRVQQFPPIMSSGRVKANRRLVPGRKETGRGGRRGKTKAGAAGDWSGPVS